MPLLKRRKKFMADFCTLYKIAITLLIQINFQCLRIPQTLDKIFVKITTKFKASVLIKQSRSKLTLCH